MYELNRLSNILFLNACSSGVFVDMSMLQLLLEDTMVLWKWEALGV